MLITCTTSHIELQAKLFRGFADTPRLSILAALREHAAVTNGRIHASAIRAIHHVRNQIEARYEADIMQIDQNAICQHLTLVEEGAYIWATW